MSKQPESIFKEKVLKDLRKIPNSFWDKIQQVSKRGTPDIYGCLRGIFVALELKRDKESKAEPIQLYMLSQVAHAGGIALVCSPENWPEYYEFLCGLVPQNFAPKISIPEGEASH